MLGSVQGRTLQVTTKSDLYNEKKMQKRSNTLQLVNVAATFASHYMWNFVRIFTVVNGVSRSDVGWCMDGCMGSGCTGKIS